MDIDARLEVIEAENDRLRERVFMLETALFGVEAPPLQLRCTAQEGRLLMLLYTRSGVVTKDAAMAALYRDDAKDEAQVKIVDVFICKIRNKAKPFGVAIETRWGLGYEMPAASKAIMREMLGGIDENEMADAEDPDREAAAGSSVPVV